MKIQFHLAWLKSGHSPARAFKAAPSFHLFEEYRVRISHFADCEISGGLPGPANGGLRVWICDRSPGSRILSSEDLAKQLDEICSLGVSRLSILIGGADGFTKEQLEILKPSLRWSFGPLTLPHELAAVVAGEQLYRAFTILKGLPYHSGH